MIPVTSTGQLEGTITLLFVSDAGGIEGFDVPVEVLRDLLKANSANWQETKIVKHKTTLEELLKITRK